MKQKEVEDVFGGKEEFANADSVASKSWAWAHSLPLEFDPGANFVLSLPSYPQLNAPQKTVMATVHTFSSCRFGVQMSR